MSNSIGTLTMERPGRARRPSGRALLSSPKGTMAVVGLGYVGLPLLVLAESKGFRAIGIDINPEKVAALRNGRAPELALKDRARLKHIAIAIDSDPRLLQEAGTIVVSVPTPVYEDFTPDLRPLKSAALSVGTHLQPGALVVIESTVNPGVCEEIVLPIIEQASGLTADQDFFFAHCPERVNPGDRQYTTANIPRVIGARAKESGDRAERFYRSILDTDNLTRVTLKEAESVKMVENAFRDINIAFVNELAMSFDKLGIDLTRVIQAASTKPFGFMAHYPGCGVGGHCIPVDPYYLIDYAAKNGFSHKFIRSAREINNRMPEYAVKRLREALKSSGRQMKGARVALLGLSYKRDVADLRESPALAIMSLLHQAGAHVIPFDPLFPARNTYRNLSDTLRASDAALIATDHALFRQLDPQQFERHGVEVVLDGRNCLDQAAFVDSAVVYRGIGR